ncbi:MAG: hypothetical protein K9I85_13575 [Saprospiraceae bacterium]|nr:hypothetical protein [Saprospiraceae bacterium]
MDNFEFIADSDLRVILIRDFNELEKCVETKASKSVLILSGSILEAILIEFFSHNLPDGKKLGHILKMGLDDLINEAAAVKLISQRSKELSSVVKNYRNLIHPGRELREKESFNYETAIVAFSLLKLIVGEIKNNYIQRYGFKAEDVFKKIFTDSMAFTIYPKLIKKLNLHEKTRLMRMLTDFQVASYGSKQRKRIDRYISPLKPEIGDDNLRLFCNELLSEVEKGEHNRILGYFEIFSENINLLTLDEQETVLIYIYHIVSDIYPWEDTNIENDDFSDLFSSLGLYIDAPLVKKKFFELLTLVVRCHSLEDDRKWPYYVLYRNLISNLKDDQISKCEDFLRTKLNDDAVEDFFRGLEKYDILPF